MAEELKSVSELYELAKNEVQGQDPTLTDWNPGSILDILTGVLATIAGEVQRTNLNAFAKTFIETADGPEFTGGIDDLENLLVDHFGDEFARPEASFATAVANFTRDNDDAGDCIIPVGTIVKTALNSSGVAQRYATESTVTMTGTEVNAIINAVVAGTAGNVADGAISIIESTLTDTSIEVTNADAASGGAAVDTDAEYREFARNLFVSIRGQTRAAIEAKAKTVPGVEMATAVEFVQTVIEYDESSEESVGDPFKIARNKLYIADADGTGNDALVALVDTAIDGIRALGVRVEVIAAVALEQDISLNLTLDSGGDHYAALSVDAQPILDDAIVFIQQLAIGSDLVRADLVSYLLALWGPAGSGDLTTLTVAVPTGDVSVEPNEKMIPDTVVTV